MATDSGFEIRSVTPDATSDETTPILLGPSTPSPVAHAQPSSFVRAVLMDVSIAVHSIIIGVALGVNTDESQIRVLGAFLLLFVCVWSDLGR